MSTITDACLEETGPVALTLSEPLEPVLGPHAPIFPPTFAPPEDRPDDKADYVMDANGMCLVDTVGSQANRLEPLFKRSDLRSLIPQFTISIGERTLDILDASHRAADAVARYSDQGSKLKAAFLAYRDRGDAEPLAKITPTSLVFGAWDSRDTNTKLPRLIESTVRAYETQRLQRAAQFTPSIKREELDDLELNELGRKLGALGLTDSPSGITPGGVIAQGGIRRETLVSLIPLRAIGTDDAVRTARLQRYIFSLCLVALTAPTPLQLRQGCILIAAPGKPAEMKAVWRDGRRDAVAITAEEATAFAHAAAKEFGVGPTVHATFDPSLVKADVEEKKSKKAARKTATAQ